MSSNVIVDGGSSVGRITIDRLDRSNALTPAMAVELAAAIVALSSDQSCRVIVLTGAGDRAFCGGYDLSEVRVGVSDEELHRLVTALSECPVPTIAMLNGHAVGAGLELACRCDIRVAHPEVRVGLPAVALGVAYRSDGLSAILGVIPDATLMLLTGGLHTIADLNPRGTVFCSTEDLALVCDELAGQIARQSPTAVSYMTLALRYLRGDLTEADATTLEDLRRVVMRSPDVSEAMAAREAKRAPVFGDRLAEIQGAGPPADANDANFEGGDPG